MNIEVKEAEINQVDIVLNLMQQAFQEYNGKLTPPSGALSETAEDIKNIMQQGGGAVIAWAGQSAVGSARYKFKDSHMYIGRVSVSPAYRGNGICKSLLSFLEHLAKAKGIQETRVEVRLSIPGNVELYQRLEYEIIEQKYYPERTDSWYVMSKRG
ncbi:Acetyltransferase (GNAT) domain-containing protein [Paenibacillus sp. 1_12]|uniref:GNAT family N-acetyltransferase n=1 Tax=Paenibacillus sp. 1_12 TaxID=1566278 RepID=UPI0008EC129D|nr:GNAT family N-acetyltransferase [Paenibacillus sp. 1_12]SFM14347.1 Acetyltransferase (GNAT) domain-containing protein [Paenibacillus sp. 1_12]